MIVLDEGHFAPRKTVNTLLGFINENARMLILSTPPVGISNVESIIEGRLPSGEGICEHVRLDYNCDACRIIQTEFASHRCTHLEYLRNRTTPGAAIMAGRAAYGQDSDGAMREIDGSARICRNAFIDPERIARLKETRRRNLSEFNPPEFLFISMDPAGAARAKTDVEAKRSHSDYSIMTGFMNEGVIQVIFFFILFYLARAFTPSAAWAARIRAIAGRHR